MCPGQVYMQSCFLLRLVCFFFFIIVHRGAMSQEMNQAQSDTAYHSVGAMASDESFRLGMDSAIASLDSLLKPVDPLDMFPQLSSMGVVAIPKGYIILLISFLLIGGLLIFVADAIHSRKRTKGVIRKKRQKRVTHGADYEMQSMFESFVISLFDPLYFQHSKPRRNQAVMAGDVPQFESAPNLEFEFNNKDAHTRFAIKCQYFKNVDTQEIQIFPPGRYQRFRDFENATGMSLYFVLGFGGAPDDPKELFLVPAGELKRELIRKEEIRRYSKSGMFFYNRAAGRLQ